MGEKRDIFDLKDELIDEDSHNEKRELITVKSTIIPCPNFNCQQNIQTKFMGELAAFIQICPICKVQFSIWIDSKTSTYYIGGISTNFKKGILRGKITIEEVKSTDFIISCPSCNDECHRITKQYVELINCKTCNTKFSFCYTGEDFHINILENPETVEIRFCARCGLNVGVIVRFCPRCGLKILRDVRYN